MRNIEPVTPGELLKEEFLEPMGISQYRLAKEIGVPAQRIGELLPGTAPLLQILICGFLACQTATGCECRWLLTLRLRKPHW